MLKIDLVEDTGGGLTLRLTGRLIGPWVDELRRCCDEMLAAGRRPVLDFTDVTFVDRDGSRLVQHLRAHTTIARASRFVAEQLRAGQHEPHGV